MLLGLARPDDAAALSTLRASPLRCEVHDRIGEQVAELVRCLAPQEAFSRPSLDRAVADATGGRPGVYGRRAW
ncbi:hypothetical protein ACFWUZ_30615 [Streptomyces sp. NPDC058646]|uniref:hypothetical protein n=1 Tax=Streptomyces sp. NPDC058646 TaxID=3346574 RepID=UPI00365D6D2F